MERRIRTKILYKHAKESAWLQSSFIPFLGELVIYDVDDQHTHQRIKIGDGVSNVNNLPFVLDMLMFVGTTAEYEVLNAQNLIKEGTLVYITDD